MTRAEAKALHARVTALVAEAEKAGAARAEAGKDVGSDGAPTFRYDVFWTSAAAAEGAGPDPV